MPIEKTYDSAATEAKLYERWEKSGAFACDVKSAKKPYTIMMPPPNVTGSLHMGHALTFTLQDILIRYKRMKGFDVLWQPGTDHAGIATQMVVERQLATQMLDRRTMGREAFLKKVWEWKAESGGTITKQLRRLGASCDWGRERFTMDEGLSKAVTHEFVELFKSGHIYRDKRLVNWDPKMLTAVSDLEVEQKEVKGHMWHFRYPLADDPSQYLCVATTRPETMLGDSAVAVNPADERYKHLIGKYVKLPLAGRLIPIIGDDHADPEKGSGAVKITPAHDFNDFEVWKRHRHEEVFTKQQDGGLINLLDAHARMNENAPKHFQGLDRYEARKKVLAELEELELLDKTENITHAVPHGDRSGVVIEPWLSEQWYCDVKGMAAYAVNAVKAGRTKFVPQQWENTFFAWLADIQPWCISRQLWWGHRIPAWYGVDLDNNNYLSSPNKIFVATTEEEAVELARAYVCQKNPNAEVTLTESKAEALGKIISKDSNGNRNPSMPIKNYGIWRDEDVLDTWFSSALWPFSTLDWPEADDPYLKRYYPGDVLVTGFDIIFFWVARMMMMGLHFMKDVPFRDVYIHALVRDEKGQKMSKTKGNVIDPLDIIDRFGCDALRFTLANMSTPGRDIRLATNRIEGNRNFATKLWNAARFCEMNECAWDKDFDPTTVAQTVNKWIVGEAEYATKMVGVLLEEYRFDQASAQAYEFVWGMFCDGYLEFTKPILTGADAAAKAETRATTAWVLERICLMLHPFMPFITETLWQQLTGSNELLMAQAWPEAQDLMDTNANADMMWLMQLISSVRSAKLDLNVPPAAQIPMQVKDAGERTKKRFQDYEALVKRLARVSAIEFVQAAPRNAAQVPLEEAMMFLPLADVIDLDAERTRLGKESEKWAAEIKKIEAKLANQSFVDRAPPEVVEEQRERKAEAEAMLAKLQAAQKSLSA